jgi:hypothetical protein
VPVPGVLGVLFGKEKGDWLLFPTKRLAFPAKSAKKVPVPSVPVFFSGRKKGTGSFFPRTPGFPAKSAKKVPVPGVSVFFSGRKRDWLLFPTKRLAFPQSQRKRCLSPVFRCSFWVGKRGQAPFFDAFSRLFAKRHEKGASPLFPGNLLD